MYGSIPVPNADAKITQNILITFESISKYSAIPPQTPAIFLSFNDLYNFFSYYFLLKYISW